MRKSLICLVSLFFIIFVLSCASKKMDETAAKEEATKETKKEEAKATKEMAKVQEQAAPAVEGALVVEDAAISASIENLEPKGIASEFSKDVPKIYCFSKVTGAAGETSIKHIWYHNDARAAEIELPVKSKSWRTYSYKTMVPEFVGQWKVDITDQKGQLLKSLSFEIK